MLVIFIVFKVNAEYTKSKFSRRCNYENNPTDTFLSIVSIICLCSLYHPVTYPDDMTSDGMPWNAEALGWAYENKINYTIFTIIDLLIIIAPTVYAWKKRETNLVKAYIILSIPALFYLVRYIYFTNFFNI